MAVSLHEAFDCRAPRVLAVFNSGSAKPAAAAIHHLITLHLIFSASQSCIPTWREMARNFDGAALPCKGEAKGNRN
jgi:hypothetical protein